MTALEPPVEAGGCLRQKMKLREEVGFVTLRTARFARRCSRAFGDLGSIAQGWGSEPGHGTLLGIEDGKLGCGELQCGSGVPIQGCFSCCGSLQSTTVPAYNLPIDDVLVFSHDKTWLDALARNLSEEA